MNRIVYLLAGLSVFILASCSGNKSTGLVEKEVSYTSDGTTMKGYLVYNGSLEGRHPGVLVVHEWWGQNAYPRRRARMLAELGYVALALDMYGDGKTSNHADDAGKFASEVMQNMDTEKARFMAAYDFLRQQSVCDTNRIAAIGYCFGGGVVLQAARFGIPLTGVVSFHGSLATQMPARPGQVRAKILVCTGDSDKFNSAETVQNFRREMDSAGADYRVIVYPGAQHSFTNPDADSLGRINNIPIGYNAAADKQSWADMQDFFKRIFPEKSSTM